MADGSFKKHRFILLRSAASKQASAFSVKRQPSGLTNRLTLKKPDISNKELFSINDRKRDSKVFFSQSHLFLN